MVGSGGLEPPRVYTLQILSLRTTIAFATISVCGLDYIINFFSWKPHSLYTFMTFVNLARYYHQHYLLRIHRIRFLFQHLFLNEGTMFDASAIPPRPHNNIRVLLHIHHQDFFKSLLQLIK